MIRMIRGALTPFDRMRFVLALITMVGWVSVAFATGLGLPRIASTAYENPAVHRRPGGAESQSSATCLLLSLTLSGSGDDTLLSWEEKPEAQSYCVERGDLGVLRATGGDFTGSLRQELASHTTQTSLAFSGTPGAGEGYWFLVKDNPAGTFDTGCPSQVGSRDFEIMSAGDICVN